MSSKTNLRKRLQQAFCPGCPLHKKDAPLGCDAYEENMSDDEKCFVFGANATWLARGARRFVKLEGKIE